METKIEWSSDNLGNTKNFPLSRKLIEWKPYDTITSIASIEEPFLLAGN